MRSDSDMMTVPGISVRVVLNMKLFVSICDTICVTNRDTSSDHFIIIKRVRVIFSHTDYLTAKTLFVCFDFVFAAVFTLSTTRTTTAAATEFTQVAAMAAPCKFLIHSKLTSLQASYTLATLCD